MKFLKTNIHFQNSSQSTTVPVPAIIFRGLPWVKAFIALGVVLFVVQVALWISFDHYRNKILGERDTLDKELVQQRIVLDSLNDMVGALQSDEDRLKTRFNYNAIDSTMSENVQVEYKVDNALLSAVSPVFKEMELLRMGLDSLDSKLNQTGRTFTKLMEYAQQQTASLKFIPSISPTNGHYGSPFGPRIHPVTGEVGKMHYGMDISNDPWTTIYAVADGTVEIARYSESFGNYVALNHGNGLVTKYGHMTMFVVHEGQFVKRYQPIGYMGATGRVTGPHLHYEVWKNNEAVNPLAYILPADYSVD